MTQDQFDRLSEWKYSLAYIEWLLLHLEDYVIPSEMEFSWEDLQSVLQRKNVFYHKAVKIYEDFCRHVFPNPFQYWYGLQKNETYQIKPLTLDAGLMRVQEVLLPVGFLRDEGGFEEEISAQFLHWRDEALTASRNAQSELYRWEGEQFQNPSALWKTNYHNICRVVMGILAIILVWQTLKKTHLYWEYADWLSVIQTAWKERLPFSAVSFWKHGRFWDFNAVTRKVLAGMASSIWCLLVSLYELFIAVRVGRQQKVLKKRMAAERYYNSLIKKIEQLKEEDISFQLRHNGTECVGLDVMVCNQKQKEKEAKCSRWMDRWYLSVLWALVALGDYIYMGMIERMIISWW